jgi:hypothetical protein
MNLRAQLGKVKGLGKIGPPRLQCSDINLVLGLSKVEVRDDSCGWIHLDIRYE